MEYQYAYLVGNLLFFIIWLLLFVFRKDLRKEMFLMSLFVSPMGPVSELFYHRDYWKPESFNGWSIGIEDFFFAFFIGGIASIIYEGFFKKRYTRKATKHRHIWMIFFIIFSIIWMIFFATKTDLNSIYSSSSMFLIVGVIMLLFRRDLIPNSFFTGFLVAALMIVFYIILTLFYPELFKKWWLLDNLSGILIIGIPIEELIWGFSWGFVAGPAYEFVHGIKLRKS